MRVLTGKDNITVRYCCQGLLIFHPMDMFVFARAILGWRRHHRQEIGQCSGTHLEKLEATDDRG